MPKLSRGYGCVLNTCGKRGGKVTPVFKNWKFSGEKRRGGGGLTKNSLHGGSADIFWNYTVRVEGHKVKKAWHSGVRVKQATTLVK